MSIAVCHGYKTVPSWVMDVRNKDRLWDVGRVIRNLSSSVFVRCGIRWQISTEVWETYPLPGFYADRQAANVWRGGIGSA